MYCKKCGKFIETDAELCADCMAKEQANNQQDYYFEPQPAPAQPAPAQSGVPGLGKAITSAILGTVGFYFIYFALILGLELASVMSVGVVVVFMLISIALGIISLIFGIQSIKTFVREKNSGRRKPIATLILGICGLSFGALTLFVAFIILVAFGDFLLVR